MTQKLTLRGTMIHQYVIADITSGTSTLGDYWRIVDAILANPKNTEDVPNVEDSETEDKNEMETASSVVFRVGADGGSSVSERVFAIRCIIEDRKRRMLCDGGKSSGVGSGGTTGPNTGLTSTVPNETMSHVSAERSDADPVPDIVTRSMEPAFNLIGYGRVIEIARACVTACCAEHKRREAVYVDALRLIGRQPLAMDGRCQNIAKWALTQEEVNAINDPHEVCAAPRALKGTT